MDKGNNKISVCMVVYNEESVIERCLKSLEGCVDEIVIVHDGECRDQTLEIAQKYGAKIFVKPHSGSSELYRAFSFEMAKYNWILYLDADEYLSQKLRKEIKSLVINTDSDAFAFRWPYTDGKKILKGYDNEPRLALFRKSKMYMIGVTHQSPLTYGKVEKRLDLTIEHWPTYNNYELSRLKTKWFKINDVQARQIVNIDNAPMFNIPDKTSNPLYQYYKTQIAHPYWFSIKRYIIFDIIKKLLRKNFYYVFIVNWSVSFMFYCSSIYCANRIHYYKNHPELLNK